MDKKEFIDKICREAGISKRELARLAGTHHTMLIKYQAGIRSLPAATMQQLAAIHKSLNTVLPAAAPLSGTFTGHARERAALCREKILKLQRKYNAMQLNWQTATAALHLAGATASNDALISTTPQKKQRWIEEQQYRAAKQLQRNGPEAQRELYIQIAVLEKEAILWEETIDS